MEIDVVEAIVNTVPLFGNDPAIRTELQAHTHWTVRNFLTTLRSGDGRPDVALPPETTVMARTLVRRGIAPEVVYQGYRQAEQIIWQRWMELAAAMAEPNDLAGILRESYPLFSKFAERVLEQALDAMRDQRADIADDDLSRRIKTVRLLLDGVPLDDGTVRSALRYDITGPHTALVLWSDSAVQFSTLEVAGRTIALAAGVRSPLVIDAGGDMMWAWLVTPAAEVTVDVTHAALDAVDAVDARVRVAVGPTSAGVDGFRRSHEGALAVHRVMAANPQDEQVLTHRELEVTALASADEARAREFVAVTLGGLAEDTPSGARLRETLRVFLDEAENAPRAAERLHMHRNTVLQRVARATQLLGYPPSERRLAVTLALELSRRLPAGM